MSSLCWECKYETSDCKGEKWVEKAKCQYFQKKLAINYPQKIRELEKEINGLELQLNLGGELCEVFRNEINRLKATLKQADEAYDSQGKQLLKALDQIGELNNENEELKAENDKLKAKIEERVECGADCDNCENKCRAWQNGFNAKGGNISFESIQMLRRIVKEVTPGGQGDCAEEAGLSALQLAIEALEEMSNTNHLCIRCANNREGCCPSQDVIACGDFKESDTE